MPNLPTAPTSETNFAPNWLLSSFAMLAILAATAALIVGLLQVVSWTECLLLLVAGIVLSCGVLYTIVTMNRLSGDE